MAGKHYSVQGRADQMREQFGTARAVEEARARLDRAETEDTARFYLSVLAVLQRWRAEELSR